MLEYLSSSVDYNVSTWKGGMMVVLFTLNPYHLLYMQVNARGPKRVCSMKNDEINKGGAKRHLEFVGGKKRRWQVVECIHAVN